MSDDNGGSAFPVPYSNERDGPTVMPTQGMTLRDYFAAKVAAGMATQYHENYTAEALAGFAYELADALLQERAK